ITAISAAPYGSALVCLISYGYIMMLGVFWLVIRILSALLIVFLRFCRKPLIFLTSTGEKVAKGEDLP
ncbi:MAG: hypothetical protein ACKO4M_06675, partial [Betaproteobacteria bacterium]